MNLIDQLNWRYAVKRMSGKTVPDQKLENILEAIRLSASSMGLQPYSILVIKNKEILHKIQTEAAKQPQVTEASHLLVFAAWNPITENHISEYINQMVQERNVAPGTLDGFKSNIINLIKNRTQEQNLNWAARQAYIALGTGLAAAAIEEVDATPMEGFDPEKLDAILNLPEMGLKSVVLMTLGYRDSDNDPLAGKEKARRKKEKLFIRI